MSGEAPGRRMLRKHGLPEKICARCGRPFAWRRKWAREWEAVRYCSAACRRQRASRGDERGGGA
jgi:hypothetical protein